jgi:broad specificity phosphatase PhoE
MTICLLIRHAAFDFGTRHLAGQSECALSAEGEEQAKRLARLLPRKATVYSSPRRRCLQTIGPYLAATRNSASPCAALDEIDFGSWTGRPFASLERDPAWKQWNEHRDTARAPNGECMGEAQRRILAHIATVAADDPQGTFILVTHAELIRSVILRCLSLSLDDWKQIDVPYASITTVGVGRSGQLMLDQRIAA